MSNAPQSSRAAGGGRRNRPAKSFPIHQDVCYQCMRGNCLAACGSGKTLEIGSREVRFTTQRPLSLPAIVRLAVAWPATLNDTCCLKLEMSGWVVRSEPFAAVARIERYRFCTRGLHLLTTQPW